MIFRYLIRFDDHRVRPLRNFKLVITRYRAQNLKRFHHEYSVLGLATTRQEEHFYSIKPKAQS